MKRIIIINIAMASSFALGISLAHADPQDGREKGSMMNKSSTSTGSKSGTLGIGTGIGGTSSGGGITPGSSGGSSNSGSARSASSGH